MKITSFKQLIVWQRAMELTKQLPDTERYGLVSQMQRCAVSIPSNIAEGRQRSTRKDFAQFLRIADGSAAELETQLLLAERLYHLRSTERAHALLTEVQKMLGSILLKL
ncbi:MAG: four helix bundle protein [Patescibacteria group bacterium]|nr:four helix bundle protein [Patescibacteria group bacterium]